MLPMLKLDTNDGFQELFLTFVAFDISILYIWIGNIIWQQTYDVLSLIWRHAFNIDFYTVNIAYISRI